MNTEYCKGILVNSKINNKWYEKSPLPNMIMCKIGEGLFGGECKDFNKYYQLCTQNKIFICGYWVFRSYKDDDIIQELSSIFNSVKDKTLQFPVVLYFDERYPNDIKLIKKVINTYNDLCKDKLIYPMIGFPHVSYNKYVYEDMLKTNKILVISDKKKRITNNASIDVYIDGQNTEVVSYEDFPKMIKKLHMNGNKNEEEEVNIDIPIEEIHKGKSISCTNRLLYRYTDTIYRDIGNYEEIYYTGNVFVYDDKDESTVKGLYPVCIHGNDCGKYPRNKYILGYIKT